MKRNRFKRPFTLLEVVVAMAILAMSLAVTLQLLFSARGRIAKTADQWAQTHMLMEGAEYLLLHGDGVTEVPNEFFAYDGYRIMSVWEDMDMDDIHTEYQNIAGQLELKACKIMLVRLSDGETVDQITVDRMVYNESLTEE